MNYKFCRIILSILSVFVFCIIYNLQSKDLNNKELNYNILTRMTDSIPPGDSNKEFRLRYLSDKVQNIERKLVKKLGTNEQLKRFICFVEPPWSFPNTFQFKDQIGVRIKNKYYKFTNPGYTLKYVNWIIKTGNKVTLISYAPNDKKIKFLSMCDTITDSETIDSVLAFKFNKQYLYNPGGVQDCDDIYSITIKNKRDIQSFWVKGLSFMMSNFKAENPKDKSRGFKQFQCGIYAKTKEKYSLSDYCPTLYKLSALHSLLTWKLFNQLLYEETKLNYYRNF